MSAFSGAGYISPSVSVADVISLRTIAIHVVIAGVPFAVAVGVPLVGVLHRAAVVAGVAVAVLIAVPLVHVGLQPAVVLRGMESTKVSFTACRYQSLCLHVVLRSFIYKCYQASVIQVSKYSPCSKMLPDRVSPLNVTFLD